MDGDPNAAGRILALLPGACKSVSNKRKRKRKEKRKEKSVYSAFEKESSARKNPMYYRTIVSNLTCGHIICMLY